jgi:hypothetical protein
MGEQALESWIDRLGATVIAGLNVTPKGSSPLVGESEVFGVKCMGLVLKIRQAQKAKKNQNFSLNKITKRALKN